MVSNHSRNMKCRRLGFHSGINFAFLHSFKTGKTTEVVPRALVLEQPKPARAPLVLPMVWVSHRFLFSVLG